MQLDKARALGKLTRKSHDFITSLVITFHINLFIFDNRGLHNGPPRARTAPKGWAPIPWGRLAQDPTTMAPHLKHVSSCEISTLGPLRWSAPKPNQLSCPLVDYFYINYCSSNSVNLEKLSEESKKMAQMEQHDTRILSSSECTSAFRLA